MADDFNFKNFKPTLKTPSTMGKKIDKGFEKEMHKSGVNMRDLKENGLLNEKEESFKKKIFNLSKMETLVYSDEYLSNIYNKLKQDAQETYGYHWNETIMNIMFNDYILDDPAYLQKYKNTVAYKKKRRGQEGSDELEKHVQDKLDSVKKDGNQIQINRSKKVSDVSKEKSQLDKSKDKAQAHMQTNNQDVPVQMRKVAEEVDKEINELFGFGKPAPLPTHTPSENDTYIVDKGSKTAVGVISPNLTQKQNIETANKFSDPNKYERMAWFSAVQNGVKNVPSMPQKLQAKLQGGVAPNSVSYGAVREGEIEEHSCPPCPPTRNPNDPMSSFSKLGEEEISEHGQNPIIAKAASELAKISTNINDMMDKLKMIIPKYNIDDDETIQAIISKAAMKLKDKGLVHEDGEANPTASDEFFEITTPIGSADDKMFVDVVNQGIDSRLEGFTKSKFSTIGNRRVFNFHNSELPILTRRLRELGTEEGESWADDIENYKPEVEETTGDNLEYNSAANDVDETTGAASSGQFSGALSMDNADKTYQNETTTSASSGQFSGPAIWAKNPKNSRFAHKPAWDGGQILEEGFKKGDYFTNPDVFKKFVTLTESSNLLAKAINECSECAMDENNGISMQQYAQNILKTLERFAKETPDIVNQEDYQIALQQAKEYANQPAPMQRTVTPTVKNTADSSSQWRQQPPQMKEHHLHSRQEKIDFILQNTPEGVDANHLNSLSDEEIENMYLSTEKKMGMDETKNGLWANIHAKKERGEAPAKKGDKDYPDEKQWNKLTKEDESVNELFGFGKPEKQPMGTLTAEPNKFATNIMGYKNLMANTLKNSKWGNKIIAQMGSYNDYIQELMNKGLSPEQAAEELTNLYTGVAESKASMKKGFEIPKFSLTEGFDPHFVNAMKTDLEDTQDSGDPSKVAAMSPKEVEDKENLFKGGAINEDIADLTANGLSQWASKNVLYSTVNPSKAITDFTLKNNISLLGLKDRAKLIASNYQLFPHGKEIRDVMLDLISKIDEMESDEATDLDEKSVSKAQQKFMGMVHAAQKGELKNPSSKVAKAAASMSDKDAEDFASTKHKGLPQHVKEDNMGQEDQSHFTDVKTKGSIRQKIRVSELLNFAKTEPELEQIEQFAQSKGITVDRLMELAQQYLENNLGYDGMVQTPDQRVLVDMIDAATPEEVVEVPPQNNDDDKMGDGISNATVGADDDGVITEVGSGVSGGAQQTAVSNQQNTVAQSNDPFVRLGRILYPFDNTLSDDVIKEKAQSFINADPRSKGKDPVQLLTMMEKSLKSMGMMEEGKWSTSPTDGDNTNSFEYFVETYHNGQFGQLKKMLNQIKADGELKELRLYLDEMGQDEIKNWCFDNVMDENWHKKDVVNPAEKGKHSGQSVADLRKQLAHAKERGDTSQEREDNFAIRAKTGWGKVGESMIDDQPDSMVNASDTSMAHTMDSPELNTSGASMDGDGSTPSEPQDEMNEGRPYAGKEMKKKPFKAKEKQQAKKEIDKEKYLSKDKVKSMNEDRKTPSMLNLDKVKQETAALTNKDMAQADALKQAKVYPDPKEFYIEQDVDKVQIEAKTGEQIEKEALAKIQPKDEGLHNVGNSDNEQGNQIPKRNLTKEEMLELALNRGKGIHNFVPDTEPSKRFEDRMKKDMGEDLYKLRKEKMDFESKAPMYNKDTTPVETGEEKDQYDKNKMNETFTGKYTDDFGKVKFIEFQLEGVKEVATVENGKKLTVEGVGNKYVQKIGEKKINESQNFGSLVQKFDFYLVEGNVVKTPIKKEEAKQIVSENFDKMKRLMNYNSNDFVNTKNSVKF